MQKDSKNKKVTVSQLEHDLQQVCEHHQRAMKLLYEKSATISEITKTVVEGLENIRQSLASLESELNAAKNQLERLKELYDSAIKNYEKYLELNPDAEDKSEVNETIERIKKYQNPPEEEDAEEVLLKN